MPYQTSNAYGGSGGFGSGMKTSQVYDPFEDLGKATIQRQSDERQGGIQMGLLKQQQAPEMAKLAQSQAHWGALFPYLQQALGGMSGGFNSRVGGQSGPGPRISGGPVWDQGRQQQQVNSLRAQGAQETAGQQQTMQDRLAGSGFGARSPLAAALATQMGMANQANVAGQVRDFRNTAATTNAQHTLQSQQAREGQYSNRMQEDIARRRNVMGYQQGLLGLLGQLM